jgi:hypothetical protein
LDVKKRFSEEQIIGFLCEAEAGLSAKQLRRKNANIESFNERLRDKRLNEHGSPVA